MGINTFVTLCLKAQVKQAIQCDREGGGHVENLQICLTSLMDDTLEQYHQNKQSLDPCTHF